METSTPYPKIDDQIKTRHPQIDDQIKSRLRTRKSPLPDPELIKIESITKSVKKKSTSKKIIPPSKVINVISNEKIENLQYQSMLTKDNQIDYVLVPIQKPSGSSVENIANNNQNIISTDLLQIVPTPQIIVKENPPPLLNSHIIEEKLDNKLNNKVNNTPKSINLLQKSPNITPSHVRIRFRNCTKNAQINTENNYENPKFT